MNTYVPNRKVLYVDDEANLLSSFVSLLRKEKVQASVLHTSNQIEQVLKTQGPFAAVISDQRMPEMDGVGVLETVSRIHPNTIRILMTGYSDYTDTVRAINTGGISHFIAKPWKDDELRALVQESISKYNLVELNEWLFKEVQVANRKLEELLDGTVVGTVRILSDILTYMNPAAASQVDRVRRLGTTLLDMLPGVEPQERWEIQRALDLFNLGIALLPPMLQVAINKNVGETPTNSSLMQNHHMVAANLLKDIPRFGEVARIIQLHGKDFDGTGEPVTENVKGMDLPLGSRLLHILIDLDKSQFERGKGRTVLEGMAKQPTRYDVELIQQMLGGPATKIREQQESTVSLEDLLPGMIILDEVVTRNKQLLLKPNFTLTETTIKFLLQWHKTDPITHKFRVQLNER